MLRHAIVGFSGYDYHILIFKFCVAGKEIRVFFIGEVYKVVDWQVMKYCTLIGSGLFLRFMGQSKIYCDDFSVSIRWWIAHHTFFYLFYSIASPAGTDQRFDE